MIASKLLPLLCIGLFSGLCASRLGAAELLINGEAVEPDTWSVHLGAVPAGSSGNEYVIGIRNPTDRAVSIERVDFSPYETTNNDDFEFVKPNGRFTIAANSTNTETRLRFRPRATARGPRRIMLAIGDGEFTSAGITALATDPAGGLGVQSLTTGQMLESGMASDPDLVCHLGPVALGHKVGTLRQYILWNLGTTTINGISLKISGANVADFKTDSPAPTVSLAPGASLRIGVTFLPTGSLPANANAQSRSAVLTINALKPDKKALPPFLINLSGLAVNKMVESPFVFGDSLSDPGNMFSYTQGTPYAPADYPNAVGRYSNGPIWLDYLGVPNLACDRPLALPLTSITSRRNLAVGGAQVSIHDYAPVLPSELKLAFADQVDRFIKGGTAISERSTAVVFIGGNDLLDDVNDRPQNPVDPAAAALKSQLERLLAYSYDHDSNAATPAYKLRAIYVLTVPPVNYSPYYAGDGEAHQRSGITTLEAAKSYTQTFNRRIRQFVAAKKNEDPLTPLQLIDVAAVVENIVSDPSAYGFTEPKLIGKNSPGSAYKRIFWDLFHPTTAAHQVLAKVFPVADLSAGEVEVKVGKVAVKDCDCSARVQFGNHLIGSEDSAARTRTVELANVGKGPLNAVFWKISGPEAAEFILSSTPAASPDVLNPGGKVNFSIEFRPSASAKPGPRTAILKLVSSDNDEAVFEVYLEGIVSVPALTIASNSALNIPSIEPSVAYPNTKFAWKRNGAALPGEFRSGFYRQQAGLLDGGSYSCDMTVNSLVKPVLGPVEVVVVGQNLPATPKVIGVGGGTSLSVSVGASPAATRNLRYQWRRVLPDGTNQLLANQTGLVTGVDKATLILTKCTADSAGRYECLVTGPNEVAVAGGQADLYLPTEVPVVMGLRGPNGTDVNQVSGLVGAYLEFETRTNAVAAAAPASYRISGALPAGLKFNTSNGVISGVPTKEGNASLTLFASNGIGSSAGLTVQISIAAISAQVVGNFMAILPRHQSLNSGLGGRLDLQVSNLGALSGKLTMGQAAARPFTGVLKFADSRWSTNLVVPANSAAGPALNLTIGFDGDRPEIGLLLPTAQLDDLRTRLSCKGWRRPGRVAPASVMISGQPIVGNYNVVLLGGGATPHASGLPAGAGYLVLKVALDGSYSWAGRSPDSELLSGSGMVGVSGEMGIFQNLYLTTTKGSLLSDPSQASGLSQLTLQAASGELSNTNHHRILGSVSIQRPADPGLPARARTYRAGFAAASYSVLGGFVFGAPRPDAFTPLGQIAGNAQSLDSDLTFDSLALDSGSGQNPSRSPLQVKPKSVIDPLAPAINPLLFSIKLNHLTSDFSGTFTLKDGTLTRRASFQGLVVRRRRAGENSDSFVGYGHFLMPQRPVAGQLATETPQFSGRVSWIASGQALE